MQAIRNIQTVENGEIHLPLPKEFWGQEVEVIVLLTPSTSAQTPTQKKSLRGCLKHYANPNLIDQEQDAWPTAVIEKHEHR